MPQSNSPIRIPPGQQLVAPGKWPLIGERLPANSTAPWQLSVTGLVGRPVSYSLKQISELPQTTRTIDIHCVTRWSRLDVTFRGVLLRHLLNLAVPSREAKYVSFVARSERNHSTSLELATAVNLETLIATHAQDQPLDVEHGGPLRNIVPSRYFYKSVKWLTRIELLSDDRLGFWEAESGYHNHANPWAEERYMAPNLDKRAAEKLIESKNFSNRDLRSIDCRHRDLSGLQAQAAQLRDANFQNSILRDADFSQANLSNAHFERADLMGAKFTGADLEGANLAGCRLYGVDFTGASLIGASFFEVDAEGKRTEATFDATTILPPDLLLPLTPEQRQFIELLLKNSP